MKISTLATYAFGVTAAAALLAGCSTGGSSFGSGPSGIAPNSLHSARTMSVGGVLITAAHPNLSAIRGGTPVMPNRHHHRKKKPDQYISNFSNSDVLQFDYPKGDASIGTISGVSDSQGECTKNSKKTFWVTASGSDEIEEFAFGGTSPIATLSESTGEPASCAIDPTTGNLAATILSDGDVLIYTNASGSGTVYSTPLIEAFFDGYDKSGNLFVDGLNSNDAFQLIELPSGSSSFKSITISNSVEFPGGVQWDGKYVTVNDQEAHAIYQYTVTGSAATLEGTVSLSGSSDCVQTWISKNLVFCPDAGNNDGEVYKYPTGGSSIATLTGGFDLPIGAVQLVK